jgi:hypothetical protein
MPNSQRKKLREVRKRLEACFTQLEAMNSSLLRPDDRAGMVGLIEYGLKRLGQLPCAA